MDGDSAATGKTGRVDLTIRVVDIGGIRGSGYQWEVYQQTRLPGDD